MVDVSFELGPVAAEPARLWLRSGLEIVAAMRANPEAVPFVMDAPMLDLVEMYLSLWERASAGETTVWSSRVDSSVVEQVAKQWRLIAAMGDTEMQALGCSWPPPEALPFHDAMLAGVTAALAEDPRTAELADDLRRQPPGTPAEELGLW